MTDPAGGAEQLTTRVVVADDWRVWRVLRQAALAEAPHAFGSKLADWTGDGDVEERWRERLAPPTYNLVASLSARPVGMASGIPGGPQAAELISMWVAPFARGRGVGEALVAAVAEWARATGRTRLQLRVVEGNEPATRLYRRCGFVDHGRLPLEPGEEHVERLMTLELRPAPGGGRRPGPGRQGEGDQLRAYGAGHRAERGEVT